jgi:hypothetical protein
MTPVHPAGTYEERAFFAPIFPAINTLSGRIIQKEFKKKRQICRFIL